ARADHRPVGKDPRERVVAPHHIVLLEADEEGVDRPRLQGEGIELVAIDEGDRLLEPGAGAAARSRQVKVELVAKEQERAVDHPPSPSGSKTEADSSGNAELRPAVLADDSVGIEPLLLLE